MSYDPSKWYSYSKDKPNEIPSQRRAVLLSDTDILKSNTGEGDAEAIGNQKEEGHIFPEQQNPTSPEAASNNLATTLSSDTGDKVDNENAKDQLSNKKLSTFVKKLQKMVRELPSAYKKKVTYDIITQLAESLLDDTVFEIVKGLEDIQQLSERNLLNRRMKILSEQKGQRLETAKRHQAAMQECQSRPHQRKLLEREHEDEKREMEEKLERELNQLDQKLVLEIDQQTIDQQATLQRAGVPLFFITNKQEEVQLQMYLLDFITRLIPASFTQWDTLSLLKPE